MFDFPIFPETATLGSWIYQGFLFAIIFFFFKKSCLYTICLNNNSGFRNLLPLLLIIYIITSFTEGDFSHYQAMVKNYRGPESTGLESVYVKQLKPYQRKNLKYS